LKVAGTTAFASLLVILIQALDYDRVSAAPSGNVRDVANAARTRSAATEASSTSEDAATEEAATSCAAATATETVLCY